MLAPPLIVNPTALRTGAAMGTVEYAGAGMVWVMHETVEVAIVLVEVAKRPIALLLH